MKFSNINMSCPSLPMVPVDRNVVRCKTTTRYSAPSLKKLKLRRADMEFSPYVVTRGQVTSPSSAWPANQTMSYDCASATCLCVNTQTATQVLYTCLLFGELFCCWYYGTRNIITQACVKLPFGEMAGLRRVL